MPGWVPNLLSKAGPLKRAMRFAGRTYLAAALALVILLAVPVVLALFDFRAYIIYGGSMGASLPNGSIGITRRIEAESIRVGDVVALKKSSRSLPVLHRVIAIDTSGGTRKFVTQGDANAEPDPDPVGLQGPGDKIIFSIPWLGYLVHFARSAAGRALLLIIPSSLLVGVVLWQTWKDVPTRRHVSEEPQC